MRAPSWLPLLSIAAATAVPPAAQHHPDLRCTPAASIDPPGTVLNPHAQSPFKFLPLLLQHNSKVKLKPLKSDDTTRTTPAPAVEPDRMFIADGLLELVFPYAISGDPAAAGLNITHTRYYSADGPHNARIDMHRRRVTLAAGKELGPSEVPSPECLAHGPLTVYYQPLNGEMRRHRRTQRRRLQDAVPENADALPAHRHGAVCDGKPGLSCTVFGAPLVFGAIGDGAARRTFLYYQDVGKVGALLDAAQRMPSPVLSVNTWSRPFAFGWKLPMPAIPITLRSTLTISDCWLLTTDETATDATTRAELFLRLLHSLLAKASPLSRPVTDWDSVVARQSEWTLHDAYHNSVPANASQGVFPLDPVDRAFQYIPTYVNDGAAGTGSGQIKQGGGAQIFSYLEQLEPGLRYLNDTKARGIGGVGKAVRPLVAGLLGKQAAEGAMEIWAIDSKLGSAAERARHEWQSLCVWGGPCGPAGQGGGDSWQIMVQMLRVAGAEKILLADSGGRYADGRPSIFNRTLNFVMQLAKNVDYQFHPGYSMAYANFSGFAGPHSGYESDALGGYILVMVEAYETFGEQRFLAEAQRASERFATDRGADEFFMSYELPMEAMGMLALAKLAAITGNATYLALSLKPLAYTLAECTLFQADHGFRDGLPTHMALAAMSGTYVAAMEGHTSAWYISEWFLEVDKQKPSMASVDPAMAAAKSLALSYIQYAGGVMRSLYPSGMPAGALSQWAYQTGAPNNASVEIPVEDYRFDRTQPGIVGQEVYGSGAAFDMAILSRRHGALASISASNSSSVFRFPQYIWPRTISGRRGQAITFAIFYPRPGLAAALQRKGSKVAAALIESVAPRSFTVKRVDQRADGHLDVWVLVGASAALGVHEVVCWLNDTMALDALARPTRMTIEVVNPGW